MQETQYDLKWHWELEFQFKYTVTITIIEVKSRFINKEATFEKNCV